VRLPVLPTPRVFPNTYGPIRRPVFVLVLGMVADCVRGEEEEEEDLPDAGTEEDEFEDLLSFSVTSTIILLVVVVAAILGQDVRLPQKQENN
jgi:hypothetical protein